MRRLSAVIALVVALLAGACVQREELAYPVPTTTPSAAPPTTTADAARPTTTPPPTTSPPCPNLSDRATDALPATARAAIDARVNDARFAGNDVSISVWVDGWGEVAARDPDQRLLPASNQKLLTAMGALDVLGPAHHFVTTVVTDTPPVDGVVAGDLVLVGGGDPTLRRTGAHSLADLARQVRASGVTQVRGSLVVDESRFDARREADGWLDWQRPAYAGALSALVVDGNRYRADAGFLADPAIAGTELFAGALAAEGVVVSGGVVHGRAPATTRSLARLESSPVGALVDTMLMQSDNMIAESLVKEIDVTRGGIGSTAGGLAEIRAALEAHCVVVDGVDADGSGLSRANGRSAREWIAMLSTARQVPWAAALFDALPLAGRSGTLSGRLTSAVTMGNVRAKTGTIIPGRALSGYFTTRSGRPAVFSILVNGNRPGAAQSAIDALVTTVVSIDG